MTSSAEVVVTSRSFRLARGDGADRLRAAGAIVHQCSASHDPAELAEAFASATHWIAGTAPVGEEHLRLAPRLRLVVRYGTGYDNVDRAAVQARGIGLCHQPGANAEAVADFALMLVLVQVCGTGEALAAGTGGTTGSPRPRLQLDSATVGLVGLGRIGRAVARRLTGLGARVLAVDPAAGPEAFAASGAERREHLGELAEVCDVVSLHRPGGDGPVIDREWLALVRPGMSLVNTARADLVDPEAIAAALRGGLLAGYASDVEDRASAEVLRRAGPPPGTLLLTPHRAGHSQAAVDAMAARACEQVLRSMAGEPIPDLIPFTTGAS